MPMLKYVIQKSRESQLRSASREKLRAASRQLPERPGVYIMHDVHGEVIYVGKAVNLKRRVSSYSTTSAMADLKVEKLVSEFDSLSSIETNSELEALLVESRLIKARMPAFNRRLTEPESCCYVKIDREDPYPKLQIVSYRDDERAEYLGPFWRSGLARDAVDALSDVFRLRRCSDGAVSSSGRACVYFEFHKCAGPCIGAVTQGEYSSLVDEACRSLVGEPRAALNALTARMETNAEAMRFERASRLREQIRAIEQLNVFGSELGVVCVSYAVVVPSYLRSRPVILLFSDGRLRWKSLVGPRKYPDEVILAEAIHHLSASGSDLLPGTTSRDDQLIIQSYLRQKKLVQSIIPVDSELTPVETARLVIARADALRRR